MKPAAVQQVQGAVTALVYKCSLFQVRAHLRAHQSVEPLDGLHVSDDSVHPVHIEHDLAQGWERRQNVKTTPKQRMCVCVWLEGLLAHLMAKNKRWSSSGI